MSEVIGPYQLIKPLGEGGMGIVYHAVHQQSRVEVALKTVKVPTESMLQTIRREIHSLARLRHPGIAQILEEGVHQGRPWYAMELISGVSLRAWSPAPIADTINAAPWWTHTVSSESEALTQAALDPAPKKSERRKRQRIEPLAAIKVVQRLCAPLAYLHGEGLVHRDLKPENILIQANGEPVLVDFGLSTSFSAREGREEISTSRTIAGTTFYMAPEQIEGELVDARIDLYALGCILYELVTGELPFTGENTKQILAAHLLSEPAPPSLRAPGLPEGLEEIILRLLAKDPRKRLGYADTLAGLLGRLSLEPPPPQKTRPYLYRPRFQGRNLERAELRAFCQKLQQGEGAFLLLRGEAGSGKTRLALEVLRMAPKALLLLGECQRNAAPLQGLRSSLQRIADRCQERGPAEIERIFGARGALLSLYEPSIAALFGETLAPPAKLPPRDATLRLFRYVSEVYEAASQQQPIVLIIDDLQWADALTLGWLADWTQRQKAHKAPVLLLGLYRQEEASAALEALWSQEGVLQKTLAPLGAEEVGTLAAEMLSLREPSEGLGQFLWSVSQGNPFFAVEYLRAAVEEELLLRDEEGFWRPRDGASFESLSLPRSLKEVLLRRIDALSSEARRVLEAASILAGTSTPTLLAFVAALPERTLLSALDELQRKSMMESSPEGAPRLTLAPLQEAVYQELPPSLRAELHHRAASFLEGLPRSEQALFAGALGAHWEATGEAERARPWYLQAARYAAERYAHDEAERLFRAYLRVTPSPMAESVRARKELSDNVLLLTGRTEAALLEHERAVQEARTLQDPALTAECLQSLGQVYWRIGKADLARASCEEALRLSRAIKARALEGKILNSLAVLEHEQGQSEIAARHYELSISINQEVGDKAVEVVAVSNLAVLRHWQNRIDDALSLFTRALSLHQEAGSKRSEATTALNFAAFWMAQRRPDSAKELFEHALETFIEIGDKQLEALCRNNLAEIFLQDGLIEDAQSAFTQALKSFEETQSVRLIGVAYSNLGALSLLAWGRYQEASELLQEAERRLRQANDSTQLAVCLCRRGHLALSQGDSAEDFLQEAQKIAARFSLSAGELGEALASLTRAQKAQLKNPGALFRGFSLPDIPEKVRRWLVKTDQLSVESSLLIE